MLETVVHIHLWSRNTNQGRKLCCVFPFPASTVQDPSQGMNSSVPFKVVLPLAVNTIKTILQHTPRAPSPGDSCFYQVDSKPSQWTERQVFSLCRLNLEPCVFQTSVLSLSYIPAIKIETTSMDYKNASSLCS